MLAPADWIHTYKARSKHSAYDAIIKSEKSAKVANRESLPSNVLLKVAFTLNPLTVPRIELLI